MSLEISNVSTGEVRRRTLFATPNRQLAVYIPTKPPIDGLLIQRLPVFFQRPPLETKHMPADRRHVPEVFAEVEEAASNKRLVDSQDSRPTRENSTPNRV